MKDKDRHRRILIVKPSSLGDVVHALPTLAALRRRYSHAYFAWLVKRQWAELLARVEGLDEIIPVDPGLHGWVSVVSHVRKTQFDLVVDLQGLLRSAIVSRLSGCRTRIGFANGREGSSWFYTRGVKVPTPDMHAVERYLLIARDLGACTDHATEYGLRITQADRDRVSTCLRRAGVSAQDGWVAINVSARWPSKRYPPESFAVVADSLQKQGVGHVVFIGAPEDHEAVASIMNLMETTAVDLTGQTSVGLLPALLSSAELLITNDSGPMHVAAAVGTKVVALFGPTSVVETGPYGPGHRVLTSNVPCRPCFSRQCSNTIDRECLRNLLPESVVDAVRQQRMQRVAH